MTGLPKDYAMRKALPLFDFYTKYFPLAQIEIVKVAVAGNEQHNPGEPLHWARGKSTDQLNTAMRHLVDHGMGHVFDDEPAEVEAMLGGKVYHLAKAAWRIMAALQLECEARDAGVAVAKTDEPTPALPGPCKHCNAEARAAREDDYESNLSRADLAAVLGIDEGATVEAASMRAVAWANGNNAWGRLASAVGLMDDGRSAPILEAFRAAWGTP